MIRTNPMDSGTSSESAAYLRTSTFIPNLPPPLSSKMPQFYSRPHSSIVVPSMTPPIWMDDQVSEAGLIRIGLAHGAVYGFDTNEEQRANPIDPTRPQLARLDYLALGDWHGELQVNERCWYSGTPETDSFQTRGRGTALLVEIDGPNELPKVTPLSTGQYRWKSLDERVEDLEDVDLLEHKLRNLNGDLNHTLVDLKALRSALTG